MIPVFNEESILSRTLEMSSAPFAGKRGRVLVVLRRSTTGRSISPENPPGPRAGSRQDRPCGVALRDGISRRGAIVVIFNADYYDFGFIVGRFPFSRPATAWWFEALAASQDNDRGGLATRVFHGVIRSASALCGLRHPRPQA